MTSKRDEAISTALGIENAVEIIPPEKKTTQEIAVPNTPHENSDTEADYLLARKTFRDLITKGNDAMESLTDLAKESESPRAYEVLSTMINTVAAATKDLFELQKKNKDLLKTEEPKAAQGSTVTVEKAVFVGTTADLLKKIKEEKNENT
jgi:hypothetical protein